MRGRVLLQALPALIFGSLVLIPLLLAFERLTYVAQLDPLSAVARIDMRPSGVGALEFTLLEAALSAGLTVLLGLPLAWLLARYRWPFHGLLRALFTMPFVMPSIVAAVGFVMLIGDDGPLFALGIDLRGETGLIGDLAEVTGWSHPGHMIALLFAHAWFNIALVIRFVEPPLVSLDPVFEESARLLPGGSTVRGRLANLWLPLIGPNLAAAATLAFIFSFTSFALVKMLTPTSYTLERLMADSGVRAGIPDYGEVEAQIVLGSATVQLLVILSSLILLSRLQRRRVRSLRGMRQEAMLAPLPDIRSDARNVWRPALVVGMLAFVLAPLLSIIRGSLRVRTVREEGGFTREWTLEGWRQVSELRWSGSSIEDALLNSLGYALITLLIALPLGWSFCHVIRHGELKADATKDPVLARRWRVWAAANDMLSMLPLALSAVLIGLGVLLGVLKTWPSLTMQWWFPVLGHVMLTTPFVVRVMLPAMRDLDPAHEQAAALLGAGPWRRWCSVRLPLLRGPAIVAASLTLAISLGEFGASWVMLRTGSTSTLPVYIDALFGRPGFVPLAGPTALAGASILMMLTLVLFIAVERLRPRGAGGEF